MSDSDSYHTACEEEDEEFYIWYSEDGTRWYLPMYYKAEYDLYEWPHRWPRLFDEHIFCDRFEQQE